MTQHLGAEQAKEVADIHEECEGGPPAEIAMDLVNNAIGRMLGAAGGDCEADCLAAVDAGITMNAPVPGSAPLPGPIYP